MSAVAVKAGRRPPVGFSLDGDGCPGDSTMASDLRQEVLVAPCWG
jgi:hypothetical protein